MQLWKVAHVTLAGSTYEAVNWIKVEMEISGLRLPPPASPSQFESGEIDSLRVRATMETARLRKDHKEQTFDSLQFTRFKLQSLRSPFRKALIALVLAMARPRCLNSPNSDFGGNSTKSETPEPSGRS